MRKMAMIYTLIFVMVIIFIGRLYFLQLATDRYKLNALNTSIKQEILYPNRGDILDRNGKLLVSNSYVYELDVIPDMINETFDTINFCELTGISKSEFITKIKEITESKDYRRLSPYPFLRNVSRVDFARIQEQLYLYPGLSIVKKPERNYQVYTAGNILGYINEADPNYIKRDSNYYRPGDLVGIAGVEKSYENELRGVKGVRHYVADRLMRVVGPYEEGKYDKAAISGKTLTLTIDYRLQEFAEKLLQNKRGAIVAIIPKTGEILALASAPTIDPHDFLNSKSRSAILTDSISKPGFDRATQGTYPPGSTFKLMTALSALQMGVITEESTYTCKHGFRYGRLTIACGCRQYYVPINVKKAIEKSCNNFFSEAYRDIIKKYPDEYNKSISEWREIMASFGLGGYLNNDLPVGSSGLIPSSKFYDSRFGANDWTPYQVIFNGIGQGDISLTPLQIANFTAAIANKGYFYTPHIAKEIEGKPIQDSNYIIPKKTLVDKQHFEVVLEGMAQVFNGGTASRYRVNDFTQGGKTGTAQNSQGEDHSVFTMIAPLEDPEIVVSAVVENGHYGSTWAAPMSSLIAELYLTDTIKRQYLVDRMLGGSLEGEYEKQWINYLKRKGWYKEENINENIN